MDESVLYRLMLARRFFDDAERHIQQSDAHAAAVAVVNVHDALDYFLGALATHLNVHIAEDLTMLRTYDRIGSAGHSLGNRTKITQLNALRNDVKHHGLPPNPTLVRQLVTEIIAFAESTAQAFLGRPLSRIHLIDAIANEAVRQDMARLTAMIEAGQYREALEQMAHVIYREYESERFEFLRMFRRHMAGETATDMQKVDFPELDTTERRIDFGELGIAPEEYEHFHYVVPTVGVRGFGDTKTYVLKKSRYLWHEGNFNRHACEAAFDFLFRFVTARERRQRRDTFQRHYPLDKITFIRDSAIYATLDQKRIIRTYSTGQRVFVPALPYVDGEWQNYGEDVFLATIYDGDEQIIGYIRKDDVIITPDVPRFIENREA